MYPRDTYGRFWLPLRSDNNSNILNLNTTKDIDITGASNMPPESVMSTAWLLKSVNVLTLSTLLTFSPRSQVYLALYFSEPKNLNETQKRSFDVSLDGKQVHSDPIVPVLGKATQVIINVSSVSQLTFQRTKDSTLPPIINALELYVILKPFKAERSKEFEEQFKDFKEEKLNYTHEEDIFKDVIKPSIDQRPFGEPMTIQELIDLFHGSNNPSESDKLARAALYKKLGPGLGVAVPFFLGCIIAAGIYIYKKGRKSKPESNTEPTSVEGKLASDASNPRRDKQDAVKLNA